jgi:serine/threonine protein phosphatase PrpC
VILTGGSSALQEDAHVAKLSLDDRPDCAFFGIYDGHGGAQVARFCAKYMPDQLVATPEFRNGNIADALKATYLAIDDKLRQPNNAEVLNQLKAKSGNEGNSSFGAITIVDSSESECMQGGLHLACIHAPITHVVVQAHLGECWRQPLRSMSQPWRRTTD